MRTSDIYFTIKQDVKHTVGLLVVWDTTRIMWRHCNAKHAYIRFVVFRLRFVLNNVTHVFQVYLTDYR